MALALVEKSKGVFDGFCDEDTGFDSRHCCSAKPTVTRFAKVTVTLLFHALQKRQISKKRPKVTDDFRLQTGRAEDFRQASIDVIVGLLKAVQERAEQFSVPCIRFAKVDDMQLTA